MSWAPLMRRRHKASLEQAQAVHYKPPEDTKHHQNKRRLFSTDRQEDIDNNSKEDIDGDNATFQDSSMSE